MKIAITSDGTTPDSQLNPRFGRTKYFLIYNDSADEIKSWEIIDNKQNFQASQGAGIQSATTIANSNCNVVITGHCGPKAFRALIAADIEVYLGKEGTVIDALEAFQKGELKKIDSADVEGHW